MQIAIIGAGNIGGTLAKGWAETGHRIYLGVRDNNDEKVRQLTNSFVSIQACSVKEAAAQSEVIVVAAHPPATKEIAESLGDTKGKIIVDTMNAVRSKPEPFASTAEALKAWTGNDHVVKCFNSTGFENMADPNYGEISADMFIAGEYKEDKAIVAQLAKDLGFAEVYDFGGYDKIPLLESFAMVWINLALMQGYGRGLAFKVLKR